MDIFSCFIIGEGTLPIQCGEILLQNQHHILGVISPDPAVRQWALGKNIAAHDQTADLKAILSYQPFDYLFSIVNNQVIPDDILGLPRRWAINYHDGPLPRYAGSQATTWALLNQEKMHGITWHVMTGMIDAGDILKQFPVAITDEDTSLTLNARCYYAAIQAFSQLIQELANERVQPKPQDLWQRTYFGRFQRPPSAGIISWHKSAKAIDSLVRALTFGTYTNPLGLPKLAIQGEFIAVTETAVLTTATAAPPGTILHITPHSLQIATAEGDILLKQFTTLDGTPLTAPQVVTQFGLKRGSQLLSATAILAERLTVLSNAIARHEPYWVKRLADLQPAPLPFTTQYPIANTHYSSLPPQLTPFSPQQLTAVFAAYLARLTETPQFDIGFSSPSQQQMAGFEKLFATQVPLRVKIGDDWQFEQIVEWMNQQINRVQDRHSYSHDIWARYPELRETSQHTLPLMVAQVSNLTDFKSTPGTALTLVVSRNSYQFSYNSGLLTTETAEHIQAQFTTLLQSIAEHLQKTLYQWALLPPAEWEQVVNGWNKTAVSYQEPRLVHQIFEAQAAATPNAPALIFEGQVMSYAELNGRANQLAHYLRQEGVLPETIIGIYMERSFEMVIAIYGILKAGGAYVPLDPSYPNSRLAYMIGSTRPPIILTQNHLATNYQLPITNLVALDTDWDRIAEHSNQNPNIPLDDDCLAYVIYTSGSTGQPKGVMNIHGAIRNRLLWMQAQYPLDASDRILQKTPYSFDVSVWEFLWPLMYGACLVIARPEGHKDNAYLITLINQQKITTLHFVPSMLQLFLATPGSENCPSLRRVICSGEALPHELQQRFFARLTAELHNLYGPTEAAIDVTYHPCKPDAPNYQYSVIGRPIANTQIYILDKYNNPKPIGVAGELHIGGVNLARGYIGRPELTGERFISNPFGSGRLYKTGDLCRFLPDGTVEYLGRIDFQVKIRGFRIELGEIETTLAALPAVREVVVTAKADRSGQQRLIAYLVLRRQLPVDDLREYLQKRLPDYMVPSAFVVLPSFPLTSSGKVNRQLLPDPNPERPNLRTAYTPPQTDLEKLLVELWETVLHLSPVGIHDNFFELGGDSIKGALFINALQEKLNTYLYIVALFEAPTIAQFVRYLQQNYAETLYKLFAPTKANAHLPVESSRITAVHLLHLRQLITPLPPHPAPETQNETAVFVLAPPRSGSTLLRVMLAGHPHLFAPPELDLLNFNTLVERRDAFVGSASLRLEGTIRALMEVEHLSADQAKALMAFYETQNLSSRDFFRLLQIRAGDKTLVDKSPAYALDIATLQRAEQDFREPRYIHLQRHPYGMICSFEEVRLDQTFFLQPHPFTVRQLAELIWLVSQQNINQFLQTVPPERQLAIKFEELVTQPEAITRQICKFLGIEWNAEMIRPYHNTSQRMTDGIYRTSRMLGDVKFHSHTTINPAVATDWQQKVQEDFLSDLTWQMAQSMGYAPRKTAETAPQDDLDILLNNLENLSEEDVDSLLIDLLTESP